MIHHVVVYSGGMDSRTLLEHVDHSLMVPEDKLSALSFDYRQRHVKELNFTIVVCAKLGIAHKIIQLPFLEGLTPHSALTDMSTSVPRGHYADESMKQTVVPGRNTLFLACALAYAQGRLASPDDRAIIYYGAHAGDHPIYPDCRPDYIAAINDVIHLGSDGQVGLRVPFMNKTKGEILKVGLALGIDYSMTLTCYNGTSPACGTCGACVERLQAFDFCKAKDPLEYEDRESYKAFI